MAERADPDHEGFKDRWEERKILGIISIKRKVVNPYRDAVYWRYGLVNERSSGLRVLDVPCGMGWGTSMLKGCASIIGLDLDKEAIDKAREKYGTIAEFYVGSMDKLPFSDRSIDLISCLEGIEHVPESVAMDFLNEANRVLEHDGLMILSSPHCNDAPHSGNPYHIREYRPNEMRQLLFPKFNIIEEKSKIVDNLTMTIFYCQKKIA